LFVAMHESGSGTNRLAAGGQSMSALPGNSDVDLFCYCQRIIDLNPEIPDGGQRLDLLARRTVITVVPPSQVAFSTTNPSGTSADGLRACCMTLIPCEPTPGRVRTSSKLSQSQSWTPIHTCPAHRYFRPCGWSRLRLFPWHRRPGSHVPYQSLIELRAAYTPDAARSVSGHPPS
jgi:hypothetical protein